MMISSVWPRTHLGDSDLSLLKLSLDAIKTAVKSKQEADALRAESHRNKFLFEAGGWFSGVINGLKKSK